MFQVSRLVRYFAFLLALAATLSGCTTTNINTLPIDASAKIAGFVTTAQDAQRASDALGWGNEVTLAMLGGTDADLKDFKTAICSPPFYASFVAVKTFGTYNEQITDLAKAPDDSLTAYIRSIRKLDEAISKINKPDQPIDPVKMLDELTKKCLPPIDQDLALKNGTMRSSSIAGISGAITTLVSGLTKIAQIVEKQKRAKAVELYVTTHASDINNALDVLGKSGGLEQVLQASRTYYLRRAFSHYSDLRAYRNNTADKDTMRPASPQPGVADSYALFAVKYLKLQGVNGTKLIEDKDEGLRAAFNTFATSVKQPNSDPLTAFDAFLLALKNVTDVDSSVSDFKKAIDDL